MQHAPPMDCGCRVGVAAISQTGSIGLDWVQSMLQKDYTTVDNLYPYLQEKVLVIVVFDDFKRVILHPTIWMP